MPWWGNGLQEAPLCPGHPGSQGSRLGRPGTPRAVGAVGGDRGTQSQGKGCFPLRKSFCLVSELQRWGRAPREA